MSETSSYLHVNVSDERETESHEESNGWEEVEQHGSVGGSHPSNAENGGEESEGATYASESSSEASNGTEDEWEQVREATADPNTEVVVVVELPPGMRSLAPARTTARRSGDSSCASSLTAATSATRIEPMAASRAEAAAAGTGRGMGRGGGRSDTSDLESIPETESSSYCGRFNKLTMNASRGAGDSYTASYPGDELTTSSETTAISGFSCLDVNGSSSVRCRRCKLFNGRDGPVMTCNACGFALSANPCTYVDELVARSLQEKEEREALAALKREERKRRELSTRPVFERAEVLIEDINKEVGVALRSASSGDVLPLPRPDLLLHASDMIEHFDRAKENGSIALCYYFCPTAAFGDARRGFEKVSVKLSTNVDAAIRSAMNDNVPNPTNRAPPYASPLFPIHEDKSDQELEFIGWIVLVVDESSVGRSQQLTLVTAPSKAYPLVSFHARIRGEQVVQKLYEGLLAACLDFFLTDWDASSRYNVDESETSAKKLKRGDASDSDESIVDPITLSAASASDSGGQANTAATCDSDREIAAFLEGVDFSLEDRLPTGDLATSADRTSGYRESPPYEPTPIPTTLDDFQELEIPQVAEPGQGFLALDGVVPVLVTPPSSAAPGSKFDVKKPFGWTSLLQQSSSFHIGGEESRWVRVLRASDLGFQWVCVNEHGLQLNESDAYVRCWGIGGEASLVPALQIVFACPSAANVSNVSKAARLDFTSKKMWLLDMFAAERRGMDEEFHCLPVRRHALLDDMIAQVMIMGPSELKKAWRVEFVGEVADGPTDWLSTAVSALLDPNIGLWKPCAWNDKVVEVNPESRSWEEECGTYFRFFGRIIGKALAEGRELDCHLAPYILKHLVGCPVTLRDVMEIDPAYYQGLDFLQSFAAGGNDVSMLGLDFTTTFGCSPGMEPMELVSVGAAMSVTNENLPDYLSAAVKHRLFGFAKLQISSLLFGVLDVVPEYLMGVLDPAELELLLCDVPEIDVEDWKANTAYTGDFADAATAVGTDSPVCQSFWQIVEGYDSVDRARLLQFVTGTCAIPTGGFAALRGSSGGSIDANNTGKKEAHKFTLHVHAPASAPTSDDGAASSPLLLLPRADRSRNRLELPPCTSLSELQTKLAIAVSPSVTPVVSFRSHQAQVPPTF